MPYDEWGNYYEDTKVPYYLEEPAVSDPFGLNQIVTTMGTDPFGGFNESATDPWAGMDWANIDWSDPNVQAQFGLTPADFMDEPTTDFGQLGLDPNDPFGIGAEEYPTTLTNDQLQYLYNAGMSDFSGVDLTDEQMAALRDAGVPETQPSPPGSGSSGFWQKAAGLLGGAGGLTGLLGKSGGLGGLLSKAGGALGDFAGATGKAAMDNPLAALTLGAGGAAALAALLRPGSEPLKAPDFTAPAQLGPEGKQLLGYITGQAGREDELARAQLPVQRGILNAVEGQLPGLSALAPQEQIARERALGNITDISGRLGESLTGDPTPTPWMLREAEKERQRFEKQQMEALGPGYVTSFPYTQASAEREFTSMRALDEAARARRAQDVGLYNQAISGQQGVYGGLDRTADVLGRLTASTTAAVPTGAAERGLGSLTGIQNQQQDLLRSIHQFNAEREAEKNRNLWSFAGTATGGGLYGLTKKT